MSIVRIYYIIENRAQNLSPEVLKINLGWFYDKILWSEVPRK